MKKILRINNINEGELSGKRYYDLRNRKDNPIDKNLELIWKENQHNYVFIRFTNAKNKALELNPNYSYSTPFGYYAYPFNQKWINNIKERNIPFAFEYNHCVIFSWDPSKSDKRTIVLDEHGEARGYTKKHFAHDLRILEEYIYQHFQEVLETTFEYNTLFYRQNISPEETKKTYVNDFINKALKTSLKETLFNKIFNLSRLIGKNARKWTEILRDVLSISCILDLKDSASIHINEPTQCVFFEPNKAHLLLDEDNILKNTKI